MAIIFCFAPFVTFVCYWIYCAAVWQTYEETWAWVHQRHRFTGDVRHIQKVRGAPMVPPPPPPGAPPPPIMRH